jgi:hypothetical protein
MLLTRGTQGLQPWHGQNLGQLQPWRVLQYPIRKLFSLLTICSANGRTSAADTLRRRNKAITTWQRETPDNAGAVPVLLYIIYGGNTFNWRERVRHN